MTSLDREEIILPLAYVLGVSPAVDQIASLRVDIARILKLIRDKPEDESRQVSERVKELREMALACKLLEALVIPNAIRTIFAPRPYVEPADDGGDFNLVAAGSAKD
jgi:hypothetical protein